ncbi:MAG TPA: pitrilysin family protein, partial [Armatimonadota bacterium]|nr:pitrilysin family protein [Armatimonadota bacterium]
MQGTHYTIQLPNGLTVVAEHIPAVRSAAFQFIVPAGAITDPQGQEGAATVLEGLCYRGAGERDARQLSDALDALGIQRGGGAELEYSTFGAALLADDLHRALEIYADILRRPHLPPEQFPAEQALALQKLERLEDSPAEKLFINLRRAFYSGSYGRTALGTEEGLRSLTPEIIAAEHARRFRPNGAILAVAGRFAWGELSETLHRCFGDWGGDGPETPAANPDGREKYRHIPQDTKQEQIGVMYPSVPLGDPDYYSMRMSIGVLSGGMSGRLFTEVREKRGLCYTVSAMAHAVRGFGATIAYAGTTPERCQETLDVLLGELKRLEEGVTDEELARARTGVLSSLVMQCEAARSRAGSIARDQYLLGQVRTIDQIRAGVEAVTPDS